MKAIIQNKYGSTEVLQYSDIEMPVVKENEVLIKVLASSVNAADLRYLRGTPYFMRLFLGLFRPKLKIIGSDLSGIVVSVGAKVRAFQPGDAVFGCASNFRGAFAQYVCAPEDGIALKPFQMPDELCAAVPLAALTALQSFNPAITHALKKSRKKFEYLDLDKTRILLSDMHVLINGASGGVGTFAVQIAKVLGATVTAVCSNRNLDLVQKLGADYVIDYAQEDFTYNDAKYDIILGINGFHTLKAYKNCLTEQGIYVCVGGSDKQFLEFMVKAPFVFMSMFKRSKKKKHLLVQKNNIRDLEFIKYLLETKQIKPVIDKQFILEEAAQALQYLEQEHAQGKVVIKGMH